MIVGVWVLAMRGDGHAGSRERGVTVVGSETIKKKNLSVSPPGVMTTAQHEQNKKKKKKKKKKNTAREKETDTTRYKLGREVCAPSSAAPRGCTPEEHRTEVVVASCLGAARARGERVSGPHSRSHSFLVLSCRQETASQSTYDRARATVTVHSF